MMQRQRDLAAGHNTAGYVTGYRGSPLGGLDQQMARAEAHARGAPHRPPAGRQRGPRGHCLLGTQQASSTARASTTACSPSGTARGRASTAPATRSATATSPAPRALGGVLVLMGDDHTCESSTTAHQSEFAMVDAHGPGAQSGRRPGDPGLRPAWHRACRAITGGWVALKCVHDTVESTASIAVDPDRAGDRPARGFRRCRRAGSTSAGRTTASARPRRWRRSAAAQPQARRRARVRRANRLDRLVFGRPDAPAGHRHDRQVLSRRAARRSTTSASTTRAPQSWACASTRSA